MLYEPRSNRVTGVIANGPPIDGIAVKVQVSDFRESQRSYLKLTAQSSYEKMESVGQP
ncbi:hypothetical protein J5X98_10700 [Leptothermofonsia sichuanensis E412]|uniref:hypothetical protein n=1 Tax=Leptothermofonsia sichuanensis TaxID=2917832 RepID=UPI001CA7A96A|nr:hypothetical protein [Leptothermofonsia sichuanensis]QZZ22775.1 hypothetical protein J5X98_10700 [Leptothermofonsia sichuanensis E412]